MPNSGRSLWITMQNICGRIKERYIRLIRKQLEGSVFRTTSEPFLAADTFYALATIHVHDSSEIVRISSCSRDNIVFIVGDLIDELITFCASHAPQIEMGNLIIHDTDRSFTHSDLEPLFTYVDEIFCINYLGKSSTKITGLPLGLENKIYLSGGLLKDFEKPFKKGRDRRIGILVAWNDSTYIESRQEARVVLEKSKNTYSLRKRVAASVLHELMNNSLFVACPRGNGLDTHRFWEAIYLGAIPLIKRDEALPIHADWPSLIVDSWSDVASMSREQLNEEFLRIAVAKDELIARSKFVIDRANNLRLNP